LAVTTQARVLVGGVREGSRRANMTRERERTITANRKRKISAVRAGGVGEGEREKGIDQRERTSID